MKPRPFLALALLAALAGCDGLVAPTPASNVEYRPELAGTVDHAMCLLGFAGVPLQRLATGHQVVEGHLNGKPARFIVDTGANISIVHTGFADTFALKAQRGVAGVAIGLGGGQGASRASITGLRLGEVETRQKHLMLADLSQLEGLLGRLSPEPIHGIIGQDVLRDQRAVIDVSRSILHLQPGAAAPAPVPAERCVAAPAR